MARIERYMKCADCKDIFKVVYDSKKEKQEEYSCTCGNLIGRLDDFGLFNYIATGNIEKLSYKESEYKKETYEDDYIVLTSEEVSLIEEIKKLGQNEMCNFDSRTDENVIEFSIFGQNRLDESLIVKFSECLVSTNGWSEFETIRKHKRLIEGLTRFRDIQIKTINKEINMNNPISVYDNMSLEFYNGYKKQKKLYDYELFC